MSHSAVVPTPPAPPLAGAAREVLRWVSCNNPFYVLSAGLFLLGLWASFQAGTGEVATWSLMGGLAGYTLLLAVTAFCLVRFAKDWEDLRTVLLLVVLMFLATSVTFDEALNTDPVTGIACNLGGLVFTILVSDALLRGIRLTLPAGYRVPYYLILALFFLYPVGLSLLADQPHSEALLWGLFGFSSAAGLVFLTLLPAIRCGPRYVQANGSPWSWPIYPWVLFGLLGLAVPARAVLLCWSMHLLSARDWGNLIFGPYFVIPFGLTVIVLLLEIGLVTGRRGVLWTALAAPLVLVGLALVGHRDDAIYQEFLDLFTTRLGGNPLYLTVVASAGIYAYAALRRVPLATEALTCVLVALAFVGPTAVSWGDGDPLLSAPILAAVVLQLALLCWRRDVWRCLLAALVVGCWLARAGWWGYAAARQFVVGIDHIALSMALFALAVLISLGKAGLLRRWMPARMWRPPVLEGPGIDAKSATGAEGDTGE